MSNIITRLFNKQIKPEQRDLFADYQNPILGTLNFSNLNSYTATKALKLSTVYRAVNVISDSVAILELNNFKYKDNWKVKQYDQLYYLLNVQPNSLMSAHTFKKLLVQNVILQGNAYIEIVRNNLHEPIELNLLDSNDIQVISVNNQIKYKSISTEKIYDNADIIHILNYTNNGLVGVSTLTYASMTLSTAYNSEEHASNFFSGGASLAGILKPSIGRSLNSDQAIAAKKSFTDSLDNSLGGKSNSVIVLGSDLEYQAISISPKDSQLLESRQFNMLTIAQYFGVPLSKLFDKTNSSYSNSESEQIDFLNSTLLPILEKIELEFYRKLFMPVDFNSVELKFDVSNLLRLDSQTQATVFNQLYNVGALTTNEIREKLNSSFPVTGGNRAFIGQNMQPLDNLLNDVKANNNNQDKTII